MTVDVIEYVNVSDAPDCLSVVDAPEGVVVVKETIDGVTVKHNIEPIVVTDHVDKVSNIIDAQVVNNITINKPIAIARLEPTAGEDIGIWKIIAMVGGSAYIADNTVSAHSKGVIGMSEESVLSGSTVSTIVMGEITNGSWVLSAGDPVYLSTAGEITQVLPTTGFLLKLGVAIDADTILLDIDMPIHLN